MSAKWCRHEKALSWCAISEQDDHRVVTLCRGRMSTSDLIEYDDNPIANRCGACERRIAELARIEAGLDEMRAVYEREIAAADAAYAADNAQLATGLFPARETSEVTGLSGFIPDTDVHDKFDLGGES